jgi:hypothetical protein
VNAATANTDGLTSANKFAFFPSSIYRLRMAKGFDYIVIGAGSGGCVVAAQLSHGPGQWLRGRP